MRKTRLVLIIVVTALLAGEVTLVVSGKRVLISQMKVDPGQRVVVEGYGDVGRAEEASLVCRYFTGRRTVSRVFWYSPNNMLGRDECSFLLSRDE